MTAKSAFKLHYRDDPENFGLVLRDGEILVGDGQEVYCVRASALDEEIEGIEAMDEDDLVRAYDTWCVSAGARQ